ncbi:MAG: GntR family transcriptional regulator [Lentisphaerae bacterium]|nr:GntR family transcriptional regulator [Lentisphaerota bacterium]
MHSARTRKRTVDPDTYGSKQRMLTDYLMRRVREGRYKPGDRVPSDTELARRFGVTAITANKVLSGLAARGILTRRRGAAGTVVSGRLGTLGNVAFLMYEHTISYFTHIFQGAADALTAHGYAIHYINPDIELPDANLWSMAAEAGFAGAIVVALVPPVTLNAPTVLIDIETARPLPFPRVNADDEGGGYRMGRHFLEAGHRRMAFITHGRRHLTTCRRGRGFVRALAEAGIGRAGRHVYHCEGSTENIPALVDRIRGDIPGLTAIGTASDGLAAAAIRTLTRNHLRVPADVSVAGFGNLSEMHALLRITTMDQHPRHMGAQAAEMLMHWIAAPDAPPDSVVVPCELIPGETVAVIRKA